MASFGKLLRDFRIRAKLSQRVLAQQAEIDTSYISRLERGEREVASRSLALKIAQILNLSSEEIDYWFISAGYISPRMQQLASSGISRLIDSLSIDTVDTMLDAESTSAERDGKNES
jgi:transcriptional regulator with XRE-family HTH domain